MLNDGEGYEVVLLVGDVICVYVCECEEREMCCMM